MNQSEAVDIARACPWLARQSPDFQDVVLQKGRLRSFARGEQITHVSDEADEFYFLADGIVVLAAAHPVIGMMNGQVLRPGQWFGEVASLGRGARLSSAVVRRDSHVLVFQAASIMQSIRENPDFAVPFFGLLAITSETYVLHAIDLAIRTPRARLCSRLLTFAGRLLRETPPPVVDIPLSQEEIALASNLSRQSVNQLLRELSEAGILEVRYGEVRILDTRALAALVR